MNLITILGQTCSGKTQMSLDLYRHFQSLGKSCWILNCDSRQVYTKLNYGTAKVEGIWKDDVYVVDGNIPHFLIDFVDPKHQYNLSSFLRNFCDLFNNSDTSHHPLTKGILPDYVILVGGTGLYAKAINEEMNLGLVKNEFENEYVDFKNNLINLNLQQLQKMVLNKNLQLNESDFNNKIRLVSNLLRFESKLNNWLDKLIYPKFERKYYCAIEILDQIELQKKIKNRIKLRVNQGLITETKDLILELGSKRIDELGLEYRLTKKFLGGEITNEQWIEQLGNENWQYAKRQMTWLRKEKNITWIRGLVDLKGMIYTHSVYNSL